MSVLALVLSPAVGLRDVRQRKLLSQRELAKLAGVSTATVNLIEQSKIRPHPSTLRKLATALGVAPEELAEHLEGPQDEQLAQGTPDQ